jgi:hypothetical protein
MKINWIGVESLAEVLKMAKKKISVQYLMRRAPDLLGNSLYIQSAP